MTKQQAKEVIKKLKHEINNHNHYYYVLNDPIISDFEYDKLMKQLTDIEKDFPDLITVDSPTQRVSGESIKEFKSIIHTPLMLSLDNTYTYDELREFDARNRKIESKLNYLIEQKIDGVAVSLKYQNRKFIQGATRGDGATGDDVTFNLRTINSIPLQILVQSSFLMNFEVRGEVFLAKEQFAQLNQQREKIGETLFANPRNATAGSLKLLDPRLVAKRKLDIFIHTIPKPLSSQFNSDMKNLELLQYAGFKIIPHSKLFSSIIEVIDYCEKWKEERYKLPYEVDGMVIKIDEFHIRNKLGETGKSPRWAVAYKYPPIQATTQVLNIFFSVGRTGVVTPVANMKPVFLSGSTISHSTLHNFDEVKRKDIRLDDTVIIEKAGEVIPQVVKVVLDKRPKHSEPIVPPRKCPICKAKLYREPDEVALRCINASCPAQIKGRLLLFSCRAAMDIAGMGFSIVNTLVDCKLVEDFADIYGLTYEDLIKLERMGDKSVTNLLNAIETSKKKSYYKVLFGLGIRHVGIHVTRLLVSEFPSIDQLRNAKLEEIANIHGIGPIAAQSIKNFFNDKENIELIKRLKKAGLNFNENISSQFQKPLTGMIFTLTGGLQNYTREQANELILNLGGNISSSVSNKTSYVVVGNEPGSKFEKAKKIGVKIITERDFTKMISKIRTGTIRSNESKN